MPGYAPFNPGYPFNGFNGSTGYLGVRFQIDANTHYGWIYYKGPVTDNDTNRFTGTIVDWAYENKPATPLLAGQKPCVDNDGDGYGDGAGCIAADCADNNSAIYDNCTTPPPPACEVALTPGSISKLFSRIFPFKTITIRSIDNATITKDSTISWGTDAVKTLFVLPGGSNTIRALVRIKPLGLQGGETLEVQVGDCVGELTVRPF